DLRPVCIEEKVHVSRRLNLKVHVRQGSRHAPEAVSRYVIIDWPDGELAGIAGYVDANGLYSSSRVIRVYAFCHNDPRNDFYLVAIPASQLHAAFGRVDFQFAARVEVDGPGEVLALAAEGEAWKGNQSDEHSCATE